MSTIFNVSNSAELISALANSTGGETIVLASGDYGSLNLSNRSYSSEVTIQSADAGNPATFSSSNLDNVNNLTFDGVVFEGTLDSGGYGSGEGLRVSNSSNISVENSEFFHYQLGAIFVGSDNITVQNNDIHDIRSDGLDFVQVDTVLIEGNHIHDFQAKPGSGDHLDMIQFWTFGTSEPSKNITISNNFLNSGDGSWTQSIFMGNENSIPYENVSITNNVIYNGHTHGISIWHTNGLVIENNTLLSNHNDFFAEPQINTNLSQATTASITNNITATNFNLAPANGGQTVEDNLLVQRTNPSGANYYGDLFVNALADGSATLDDLKALPGGLIEQLGVGSTLTLSGSVPGNTAPVAVDDAITVAEDGSATFQPTTNDTDADGDSVTVSNISSAPSNGTALVNGDGTVTYTPDADFNGTDSFDVRVSDGRGGFDISTVTVTVTPSADAPIAVDDTASAEAGTPVVIDVLGNDSDPDGDSMQVTAVTQGANGTVVINGDGTLTYTPGSGFAGTDSFSYTVSDGNGGTDTATVTISPIPAPVLDLSGRHTFDGSNGDVINLAHDASLEVPEVTIAFSFNADNVNTTQGLVGKGASGFGDGGHVTIWVENGTLKAGLQTTSSDLQLTHPGLTAGQEYEVALTFGASGAKLYVDGTLVAQDLGFPMTWTTNQEYLQVGGIGWASQSGQGDFTNPFAGEINDVQIFSSILDASQISTLALARSPINGTAGDDTLVGTSGNDEILGQGGNDTLTGADGDDTVDGGTGDDLIVGGAGAGNDAYNGGDDIDTLTYVSTSLGVSVNLLTGVATGSEIDTDTIVNVENIIGGFGNDTIVGDGAVNVLNGGDGDDALSGGDEADVLYGGLGDDTLNGDAGNDRLVGNDGADTLYGGDGADTLLGYDGDDTMYGGLGNDILLAATGNDTLYGGAGADTLFGYDGDDQVFGGDDNDLIYGHAGDDILNGGNGDDTIAGHAGMDTLNGGDGNDRLLGYEDDDILNGGLGDDILLGGTGNDTLNGDGGNDLLIGHDGLDALYGGDGVDTLLGYGNDDTLYGGDGVDTLLGSTGNDILHGDAGADILYGNDGDDQVFGGADNDQLSGHAGNDTLNGGDGDDSLAGHDGADILNGDDGDDRLLGYNDDDTLNGGLGNDILLGGAGNDALNGDDGNDTLLGYTGNDTLSGGAGNDTLFGQDGIDILIGGAGLDQLYGGSGADSFAFVAGSGTGDLIRDWEDSVDMIDFTGEASVTSISDLTITTVGANAQVAFGADSFIIVGAAGAIDASDFWFV